MKRRIIIQLSFAAALAAAAGCLSPTLPLPPPSEPDGISPSGQEQGVWDVRGTCTPGATVLIKNLDTGVIAGTDDKDRDGRYFVRVDGEACDRAEVWELVDGTGSDATFFVLQPVSNSLPSDDTCSEGSSVSTGGGNGGNGGNGGAGGAGGG